MPAGTLTDGTQPCMALWSSNCAWVIGRYVNLRKVGLCLLVALKWVRASLSLIEVNVVNVVLVLMVIFHATCQRLFTQLQMKVI